MYRSTAILEASGVTVVPPLHPKNSTSTLIPMAIPSLSHPIRLHYANMALVLSGFIKVNEAMDDASSTDNDSSSTNNNNKDDNNKTTPTAIETTPTTIKTTPTAVKTTPAIETTPTAVEIKTTPTTIETTPTACETTPTTVKNTSAIETTPKTAATAATAPFATTPSANAAQHELQGASCMTGRILCGHAQGNVYNMADDLESGGVDMSPTLGNNSLINIIIYNL